MADPEVKTAQVISGGGICEEKMVGKPAFPFEQEDDAPPRLLWYPPKAFAVKSVCIRGVRDRTI